jgi:hypothetical protein
MAAWHGCGDRGLHEISLEIGLGLIGFPCSRLSSCRFGAGVVKAETDPKDLSAGFWSDWSATKSSEKFNAIKTAADCGCSGASGAVAPAPGSAAPSVYNIAITKPAEAAKFLNESLRASDSAEMDGAVTTVAQMRIAPQTMEAASAMVAPEVSQRAEVMTANLTTGIQGLPGIYLGDNAQANADTRPPSPAGFTPVSGGSMGCPSR